MPNHGTGARDVTLWDDRDLQEAYLLIPAGEILCPSDHAILDEMHRRACGGARAQIAQRRPRLWAYDGSPP